MQITNSKSILRVLAMLMVLVLTMGCFAACGGQFGDDDDSEKDSGKKGKKYEWEGLYFKLDGDFEEKNAGGDYALYQSKDEAMTVMVHKDTVSGDITDSESLAEYWVETYESQVDGISTKSKNGVTYTVSDMGDGTTEVRGFYVDGDDCWSITVTSYEYSEYKSEMVAIATSGEIDEDRSGSGNKNDDDDRDDEDEDYEDERPTNKPTTKPTTKPTQPPTETTKPPQSAIPEPDDDGTITVYSLIPEAWGDAYLWAWSNATGEDAFEAWPGVSMKWNGEFYEATAPDWVDNVIVSGSSTIQTEDIPIEPGYDLWVILRADGEYYYVFDYEPSSSELAELGY